MTVGWGGLGYMWKRPLAVIVVRPTRYTYEFLEKYPDFTLSQFPPEYSEKVAYCGAHTGRKVDKVRKNRPHPHRLAGAWPPPSSPRRSWSWSAARPTGATWSPAISWPGYIEGNYPAKDYHRLYFGEVLAAAGTAAYQG